MASEGFYDRERDVYYLRPTVIYRMDSEGQDAVTVEREDWRAALVFGSEEEAEKFRAETGKFPASEGFEARYIEEPEHLAAFLDFHDCTHVAMPEAWGAGGVNKFKVADFLMLLELAPLVEE